MTEDPIDPTDERLHDPEGPDTPNRNPPPPPEDEAGDEEEEPEPLPG